MGKRCIFGHQYAESVHGGEGEKIIAGCIDFPEYQGKVNEPMIQFFQNGSLVAADYSDGYYSDLPPKIVVRAGDEGNYTSLEDFAGKAVGAQTATTKETIVTKYMTGADLVSMSSVVDLVNNLVYGKCDALVLDGAVADQYLASNSDLAAVDIDMSSYVEPYRVWVAKGDPKGLLPSINETIAKVLSDGTMDGFIEKADELSSQALEG